jgi:hypothetical protein
VTANTDGEFVTDDSVPMPGFVRVRRAIALCRGDLWCEEHWEADCPCIYAAARRRMERADAWRRGDMGVDE